MKPLRRSAPLSDTAPALFDDDIEDFFEVAPCGYVIADGSGRIVRVNRTLADWLEQDRATFPGRRFPDLLNIAGKIYYETHFAPLLRMQGFFHEVALDLALSGRDPLPVLVNAAERTVADGSRRILITIFNAKDRRRYERELLEARRLAEAASSELNELNLTLEARVAEELEERLKAEEALRQAQKMEAVGQLTGGVAHDFNNLLTVIIGGLETVSRQLKSDLTSDSVRRIERAVAMATHGAERAATLTARLLAFARRQPLDPRPVDPGRLVTGLADLLQRTLGETVEFQTVSGAGLWLANTDAGELENALVNLAVNARDAMPGGGCLTIETSNAYLDEDYVGSIPEPVTPGEYVLIAVSDTGTGMDQATMDRVFEPFFTTKDVGKGTGLGLSQVYGFVRQSGGHVRVYSEMGLGTTIKIYLPRLVGGSLAATRAPDSVHLGGGSETILLVEDHEDLRAYAAGVLGELGYKVLEASNGRTALDLLQSHNDVALLFTDVVMPEGLDGRQLAEEAVRRRPGLKVLYTTGYTRNAIVHNGRLDAGVNLISKPFTFRELASKVRLLLDADTSPLA